MTEPESNADLDPVERMYPSEVRQAILSEHDELRAFLGELEHLVAAARRRDRDAARVLPNRARRFVKRFLCHIELENEILVPALRDADAWGEERAERVLREHADQRAELEGLLEALRDPVFVERAMAPRLAALTEAILTDMAVEERSVLAPDVLRDDIVGIDVEAG